MSVKNLPNLKNEVPVSLPTVIEIWSLENFGVTTLTFWDHVTSSVT